MRLSDLPWHETADGRPEWQVRREMEERIAVWLAKKRQATLLTLKHTRKKAPRAAA